jgi:MinD-like ATPase involved in chromosome partitioning or flagellar assembly
MTMQYDVKSYHASASGTAVSYATRLKAITVTSGTSSLRNIAIADPTVSRSGTYSQTTTTITVTIAGHNLVSGQRVFLDCTSGTGRDAVYAVTVTNANVFTVTSPVSTSTTGNATFYPTILMELDTYTTIGLPVKIPGEGIYCPNGIYVGLGATVTATIYYG